MTDRYAVIGNPIDHSKSPVIHTLFAQATGQDIEYTRVLGPLDGFVEAVRAFRGAGGRGMNVTAPFKLEAFALATEASEQARWAGAANALRFEGDTVLAENFDGIGLARDVVHNLGLPLNGRRVLVLGAGGATRGLLLPLLREAPALLAIANRTPATAEALAAKARERAPAGTEVWGGGLAEVPAPGFDLVLNATSASVSAERPQVADAVFGRGSVAYELAYGKGLTPFLRQALAAGAGRTVDGVGMLVEQAAEAFAWWRGVRPATREVIERLSVPLV